MCEAGRRGAEAEMAARRARVTAVVRGPDLGEIEYTPTAPAVTQTTDRTARSSRTQEPDSPRGLLEPCAATSGKHGSEEGGAGKRRPLSDDNRLHWVRDVTYQEDKSLVRTGNAPRVMASLRSLAISLLRLDGHANIAAANRHHARNPQRTLKLLQAV